MRHDAPAFGLSMSPLHPGLHASQSSNSGFDGHACYCSLVLPAVADGCAVSRKACKNCTCGRAEEEAAGAPPPKLTLDMLENPGAAGGCGSCQLGDAFRCASCPYRGLPSFQPGKKIELPTGFLAADI